MNNWEITLTRHLDNTDPEYTLYYLTNNGSVKAYLSYLHNQGYWYIDRYGFSFNDILPSGLLEYKFAKFEDAIEQFEKIKDWLNENQL